MRTVCVRNDQSRSLPMEIRFEGKYSLKVFNSDVSDLY
jgi:hypothetical protein